MTKKRKKEKKIDLSKSILEEIKTKKIQPKPRLYFILGSFLMGFALSSTLVVLTFFLSMMIHHFKAFGTIDFLRFGLKGQQAFIGSFPWVYFLVTLVSFILGLLLIKKYDISYKFNWKLIVMGVLSVSFILGLLLDQSGLHEKLTHQRMMRNLYEMNLSSENWILGQVSNIDGNKITLITKGGKKVTAVLEESTMLPPNFNLVEEQMVGLVGEWKGDIFYIIGVGPGKRPNRGDDVRKKLNERKHPRQTY